MDEHRHGLTTVLIYGGRIDQFFVEMVGFVVRRTWIRYTRFTPQLLARLLLVPYIAGTFGQAYAAGTVRPHTDWPVLIALMLLTAWIVQWVERRSQQLEILSSTQPTIAAMKRVVIITTWRPGFCLITLVLISFNVYPFTAVSAAFLVQSLSLVFAICSLTIARPFPPRKKDRKHISVKLPRLAGLGSQ